MSGNSPIKVLVVDDGQDAAVVTTALVRLWGYAARACFSCSEALTVALDFRPDVILLDLATPKFNGFDVLRRIRRQAELNRAYVVALMGYGPYGDHETTAEACFDLRLLKPVAPDQLKAVLESVELSK